MSRVRTLIIEDDPAVAALHRGFVERHPRFVVVGEARTGADALHLIGALRPELVLLDIHLPDITGLDVLHRMRHQPGPPVDVIATTAARELDSVRRAMAGGVQHYLVKPFTAVALSERLDEVWALREDVRRAATQLDQADVDRLLSGVRTGASRLPKGLSERSLALVEAALRDGCAGGGTGSADRVRDAGGGTGRSVDAGGDLSSSDVAARTGMSRVSARRYLEYLVETGRARVTPRYGSAGRPENRYSPAVTTRSTRQPAE